MGYQPMTLALKRTYFGRLAENHRGPGPQLNNFVDPENVSEKMGGYPILLPSDLLVIKRGNGKSPISSGTSH